MLNSIYDATNQVTSLSFQSVAICTVASLIMGMAIACIHMFRNRYTKHFVLTLAILPTIVQMVIMLVNGNLGTGVAVMGAFSLVRFRSTPGTSREIGSIFLSMAVGLATGMGYIGVAFLFLLVLGAFTVVLNLSPFGNQKHKEKELKVTIPENLDYQDIFDDLFSQYARKAELIKVKTTNMGSLYELQYIIVLKDEKREKEFIDALRCRNGNLTIVCGRIPVNSEEL